MKRLQNILGAIHGWPDEARQLLAVALMVVASVAVFSGWNSIVSSSLTPLSGTAVAVLPPIGSETAPFARALPQLSSDTGGQTTVLSPLGGIVESLRGLAALVAKIPSLEVDQTLDSLGRFLYRMTK